MNSPETADVRFSLIADLGLKSLYLCYELATSQLHQLAKPAIITRFMSPAPQSTLTVIGCAGYTAPSTTLHSLHHLAPQHR